MDPENEPTPEPTPEPESAPESPQEPSSATRASEPAPKATPDDTAERLNRMEGLITSLVDKIATLIPDTPVVPTKKPWISR